MKNIQLSMMLALLTSPFVTFASELTIPNTFVENTPALASEVNANFTAVETSVDDNAQDISSLQSTMAQLMFEYGNIIDDLEAVTEAMVDQQAEINALNNTVSNLQAEIVALTNIAGSQAISIQQLQQDLSQTNDNVAAIESNTVLELDGLLRYSVVNNYPTAEFTGVNIQVNNGTGTTDGDVNGLGNITIGYNETSNSAPQFCSAPYYTDENDCLNSGNNWGVNVRRGSHNLTLGLYNSYDDYGSIILGNYNISNGKGTFVGGFYNSANGDYSSVLGGSSNISSGNYSSVSGGSDNLASGENSTILGGYHNKTTYWYTSIAGGSFNLAKKDYASILGGTLNVANGVSSTISGGYGNTVYGDKSSVSGGYNRTANAEYDWKAGSLFEEQ